MQQEADVVQDLDGNAVAGAAVQVLVKATGELAKLFADDETTEIANPVYTDANGRYAWKAANGKYKSNVVIGGRVFVGKADITLFDPADDSAASDIRFIQAGAGAVPRPVEDELRERVSVTQFGAKCDGVTDDTAACQKALDYIGGIGRGMVTWPAGVCKTTDPLLVWSNTHVKGAGMGATVMLHPESHCFKNKHYASTGNEGITVSGFSFDAGGTYDGAVSMVGVRGLMCHDLRILNLKPDGVTVGIGVGASATANTSDVTVKNCVFDVPDYGVVFGSSTSGTIERVRVEGCNITTAWGSCISLSKVVRRATITGNHFVMPADSDVSPGVGIGVKLWEGADANNAPEDVAIAGNTFLGSATRTSLQAISANNWTNNLTVTGNTFRSCTYAFFNNFAGAGANNITFSDNVVKNCDYGFYNDNSSDVGPIITGNQFRSLTIGVRSSLNGATVSCNKFIDIAAQAIYANSSSEMATITGNSFVNVGAEAVLMSANGISCELCNISGNTFSACCIGADSTYSVIQLNDQSHIVSNNIFRNDSTTAKPKYIIGRHASSNNCVMNGNWMFGARLGYREITHVGDVYADNKERGGIS